jgi:hypothetical protein
MIVQQVYCRWLLYEVSSSSNETMWIKQEWLELEQHLFQRKSSFNHCRCTHTFSFPLAIGDRRRRTFNWWGSWQPVPRCFWRCPGSEWWLLDDLSPLVRDESLQMLNLVRRGCKEAPGSCASPAIGTKAVVFTKALSQRRNHCLAATTTAFFCFCSFTKMPWARVFSLICKPPTNFGQGSVRLNWVWTHGAKVSLMWGETNYSREGRLTIVGGRLTTVEGGG